MSIKKVTLGGGTEQLLDITGGKLGRAFIWGHKNSKMDDLFVHPAPMLAILGVTMAFMEEEEANNETRIWMKPWLRRRDNPDYVCQTMYTLYRELLDDGEELHLMRTLRMPPAIFEELLELLRPHITKKTTKWRKPICAEVRLCITLRFLCLGDGFWSIHQQFRVGLSTVAVIVYETVRAIYKVLQPMYMQVPKTEKEWKKIASDYNTRWNLPNVIGAVDGKHIRIQKPRKSESVFHNYKQYFSIVLMAVVDANYNFVYIDVGAEGSASDGGIWGDCSIKKKIVSCRNPLNIPPRCHVEGLQQSLSFYLVGDDAFPLSTYLMKPYPGQGLAVKEGIFNYRLSRCRRIVENAFGILTAKFAMYRQDLRMRVDRVEDIVKATCALHNFMRARCGSQYIGIDLVDHEDELHRLCPGTWRQVAIVEGLAALSPRNSYQAAKAMRNHLASYCVEAGSVDWQYGLVD